MNLFKIALFILMSSSFTWAEARVSALIQKYETDLFPYADPFASTYSLEQARLLFEKLKNIRGDKTPLALISQALLSFHAKSREIDTELVKWIIQEGEITISSSGYARKEKQSNLLALYYLRDYLARFEISEKPEEKLEDKQEEQAPKEYPDLPEDYTPHTKDTEQDKKPGKKEDQIIITETNFPVPYLGQRRFSEIVRGSKDPFKSSLLPGKTASVESFQSTGKELITYLMGKKQVHLFMPPGYEPLQPEDPRARIELEANGSYLLKTSEVLAFVKIPLRPVQGSQLSPVLREIYTRPVGFLDSEWPALIRSDLFDKTLHSDAEKAKAVMNHLATKYLYSVGARSEKDPIEALKAGAFQCDMAAYLMVGILRDVYQIPARAVIGYRAKKHGDGKNQRSYLVLPGEAHAWVEAYIDGVWRPFDPTPVLKDKEKEDSQEGEKDEYSDRTLEEQPKPEEKQENSQKSKENSASSEQDQKKDGKELAMDSEELASLLKIGSLELSPHEDRSPLRERASRVLLRLILDPNEEGVKIFERLEQVKRIVSISELKDLISEQLLIHEKKHPPLKAWFEETQALLDRNSISETYSRVYRIQKALEGYVRLLDSRGPVNYPRELLFELNRILQEIHSLAHVDSHEIAMVATFYNTLPWIVQTLLGQQYGLYQVGTNAPTKEVARLLKSTQLDDLKLLSLLSPLTDFILNSTPRPEFEEVRTWISDAKKPVGRDLLPAQRFSELARSMLGQPGRSIEENWKTGQVYTLKHRQRYEVPTGFGKEDAERITIVLYDTSGSMSGDPALFQAGLISAFTAKALSDLAPSGTHRHRIVLVPFDDKVGNPIKITNTPEALDILHHYASKLHNTGGGTDIQAALIQALALIADAERRSGEPLAAANIILMTDGQSELDIQKLTEARSAIDRTTPLQIMFIAIGSGNDDLRKFVQETKQVGFDSGMYREFSSQDMTHWLQKSKEPWIKAKPGEIYTDKKPQDLSVQTRNRFTVAAIQLTKFARKVKQENDNYISSEQHLKNLETSSWNRPESIPRPMQNWIKKLRGFGYTPVLKNNLILREQLANDISQNFEVLTGINLQQLSQDEQIELKHYFCHAANMGTLGCP